MKRNTGLLRTVLAALLIFCMCLTGCGKKTETQDAVVQEEKTVAEEPAVNEDDSEEEAAEEQAASTETAEEETTVPLNAVSAYQLYLGMDETSNLKAIVDEDVTLGYSDRTYTVGESFTFEELCEQMLHGRNLVGEEAVDPVPYFAFLNIDGETLLALKYQGMNIYDMNDDSFSVLILKYENEELHVTYSYSDWARQSTNLRTSGVLLTAGSAGAGENIYDGGFIDGEGQYHQVFMNDWVTDMWMTMAEEVDNDAYFQAYIGDEENPVDTGESGMALNIYHMGDEVTIVPEHFFREWTTADEKFVELLEASGTVIATQEEVDKKIEDSFKELAGIDDYTGGADVIWNPVPKDVQAVIPARSSDWTASWNYETGVSERVEMTDDLQKKISGAKELDEEILLSGAFYDDEKAEEEIFYFVDSADAGNHGGEFKFYLTNRYDGYMMTPDNYCLRLKGIGLVDFIYGLTPEMTCDDYDGDGTDELFIKTEVFHGTGFLQNSAFMVDSISFAPDDVYWGVYHLTPEEYIDVLLNHVQVSDRGDDLCVSVDGTETVISKNGDTANMDLIADQLVEIHAEGKNIIVETEPMLFSENNPIGISAGKYRLTLNYTEYNNWEEAGFEVISE